MRIYDGRPAARDREFPAEWGHAPHPESEERARWVLHHVKRMLSERIGQGHAKRFLRLIETREH